MDVTPNQVKAALAQTLAIAECIRDLKEVPAGELYARVMGHMSHESFESIITILTRSKMIERRNHVLYWIEPRH